MNLRLLLRVLLFWSTLYHQTPEGSAFKMAPDLSETSSRITFLEEKQSTLQIKSKTTVSVILGNAKELQCRKDSTDGLVTRWQTPFGWFGERSQFSSNDPIEVNNGNLRISKVTLSHTGLYSCHLVGNKSITVIPYQVNVLNGNTHEIKTRIRAPREAEASPTQYSDTHFAAAVSSSVLVTFIGAFTLGAFSQPYVIKCLQRTWARMRPNKSNPQTTRTVFFHKDPNSEEDTVDFVPEASASIKTPPTVKTHQENQDDDSVNNGDENSINSIAHGDAGDESDQPQDQEHQEEGEIGPGPETITHKQSKQVSRVIKIYNYDEDGNRYSHIKEPESNPTPRQRVQSLTRLQSIMNEAESPDFLTSRDSPEPDDSLSMA